MSDWLDAIRWNDDGLVPAIAVDDQSGAVLTLAWMNREALRLTDTEGRAVYWSRSRKTLWRKGEISGHKQIVKAVFLDCDHDALLLKVEQVGGIACHTGRAHCFYQKLQEHRWIVTEPVLKSPETMYPSRQI